MESRVVGLLDPIEAGIGGWAKQCVPKRASVQVGSGARCLHPVEDPSDIGTAIAALNGSLIFG